MANKKHLRKLRKGVHVWNQWRINNPRIRPDLSDADLAGDQLSRANLKGAILIDADLRQAKLISVE